MRFTPTALPEVLLIEPDVFQDARGFFLETWHQRKYAEGGIHGPFVQDNHSHSGRGTLRGLHAQLRRPQGKLVRAVEGEMFDVAVDIRPGSPRFGRWVGVCLSGENFRQLWIPPGFAHGFCVTSERVHGLLRPGGRGDGRLERPGDRHRLAGQPAGAVGEGRDGAGPAGPAGPAAGLEGLTSTAERGP